MLDPRHRDFLSWTMEMDPRPRGGRQGMPAPVRRTSDQNGQNNCRTCLPTRSQYRAIVFGEPNITQYNKHFPNQY